MYYEKETKMRICQTPCLKDFKRGRKRRVYIDDAVEKFNEHLSDKFAVDDWREEDEDFLLEAAKAWSFSDEAVAVV